MKIRLLLSILTVSTVTSCYNKADNNISKPSNKINSYANNKIESNEKNPVNSEIFRNKVISSNRSQEFTLYQTTQEIESKGILLNLEQSTDDCYTDNSHSGLQLLFLRDRLISVDLFDSNYQTDKGFKVGDTIKHLLNVHPEVEYHESTSNMGDESYFITTRTYKTPPDSQGNLFIFHVSDNNPDTISNVTLTNYSDDYSLCNFY